MLEVRNIVGIHFRDPEVHGRMYLADEENTLTKDATRARLIEPHKMHKAIREIKGFSSTFFTLEVADDSLHH